MNLILARQAGSPPPDRDVLHGALRRQPWLTHRPHDELAVGGTFAFPGGGLYVTSAPVTEGPYVAPWLYVWLTEASRFAWVAPRLLALAGDLGLGIDTTLPSECWWEAPRTSTLDPRFLERAVTASATCRDAEAWLLFSFVLADLACLELAESNPALAALAASMNWFRREPRITSAERRARVRDLARRPRQEILRATGGRPTRSMVRLLARIVPERVDVEALRLLTREGLPASAERALRHLPRFRCGIIHLAADPRLWPHVGPQLLREAAQEDNEHATSILLRDTVDMAERLGAPGRVRVVPSRARLVELHDGLVAEWNARPPEAPRAPDAQGNGRKAPAPQTPALPPPAGTATIVPLRTAEDLRQEGAEMKHCVASYDRRVTRGECVVYRVTAPERATLSIEWSAPRRAWTIEQLLGPENRPVVPATQAAVQRWLDREDSLSQEDLLPQPQSGGSRASRHSQMEREPAA